MKQEKAVTFHGGVKRIRPAYFLIAGLALFVVFVVDTKTIGLIAPGVLARAGNASNYIVKMGYRTVFNNRRNISSLATSTLAHTLFSNSTSFSSRHPTLKVDRNVGSPINNSTMQTTIYPKTKSFATTSALNGLKKEQVTIGVYTVPGVITTVPRVVTTVPRVVTIVPRVVTSVSRVGTTVLRVVTSVTRVATTVSRVGTRVSHVGTTVSRVGTTVHTGTHNMTQVASPAGLTTLSTTSRINHHHKNITLNQGCSGEFKLRHLMTVSIMGRTGNHLFQLCTLIATADDACFTAFLYTQQKLGLDSIFDIGNVVRIDVNISTSNFRHIGEQGWSTFVKPIVQAIDPYHNVTLFGYFQAFQHFQHKKELCRSSLVFKQEVVSDVSTFFNNESLQNKTKIGIHIRRGDFVTEEKIKLEYSYPM